MRCDQCGCTLFSCQCGGGPQNELLAVVNMIAEPIDVGNISPDELDAILAERAKLSGTKHEHSHMLGGYRAMYQLLHEKFQAERERIQRETDELRTLTDNTIARSRSRAKTLSTPQSENLDSPLPPLPA